jgi:hypothetical protein
MTDFRQRDRCAALHRRRGSGGSSPSARGRTGRAGATQLEYVILALLVATACVVGVVVFSRAVAKQFMTAATGATLQHTQAQDDLEQRQKDIAKQGGQAEKYHDSLHK